MYARLRCSLTVLTFCLALVLPARAYSVLTHEQLIDLTWQSSVVPLLLSRYPSLTPAQIEHARAYAYGGCVIQDIGYYPFGDALYSDLTHYVRSGDFVVNLFRNAGNADELAFAVGALSHYIGDTVGHAGATNLAVPVEFPKLRARFGDVVNYGQGEHQHVQVEFAYDINEITHHRLAPVHYLRHVGLEVPVRQLALAFYQTYGIREDFSQGRGRRVNVDGYRFAVRRFIPRIAYAVTLLHRSHEPTEVASEEIERLDREVAAVAKANDWDAWRRKPGPGTYLLAGLLRILPKLGSIKLVAVKGPTQQTEVAYIRSVLQSEDALNYALRRFTPPPAVKASALQAAASDTHADPGPGVQILVAHTASQDVPRASRDPLHPLVNRDLDTGNPTKPSGYRLTDETYADLLHRLAAHPDQSVPPGIKIELLGYYSDLSLPFATKSKPGAWAVLQQDLVTMRSMPTSNEAAPYATYGDDAADAPAF